MLCITNMLLHNLDNPNVFRDNSLMDKANAALGIGDRLSAFALIPVGCPAEERPQQDRFDANRIHFVD